MSTSTPEAEQNHPPARLRIDLNFQLPPAAAHRYSVGLDGPVPSTSGPVAGHAVPSTRRHNPSVLRCASCKATHTPEWRKGPSGKRDLCNGCGLRYARSRAKRRLAGQSSTDHPPSASDDVANKSSVTIKPGITPRMSQGWAPLPPLDTPTMNSSSPRPSTPVDRDLVSFSEDRKSLPVTSNDTSPVEHASSSSFADSRHFSYDSSLGLNPHLQFPPQSTHTTRSLPSPSSPYLSFNSTIEYEYKSGAFSTTRPPPTTSSPPPPTSFRRPPSPLSTGCPPSPRSTSRSPSPMSTSPIPSPFSTRRPPVPFPISRPPSPFSTSRPPSPASDNDMSEDRTHTHTHTHTAASADTIAAQIRRQRVRLERIESEERRRAELRDGYRSLKAALPAVTYKSSKVALLERAATHIFSLESAERQLRARVAEAEAELEWLRAINELLSAPNTNPSAAAISQQTQQSTT